MRVNFKYGAKIQILEVRGMKYERRIFVLKNKNLILQKHCYPPLNPNPSCQLLMSFLIYSSC